MDPNESVWHLLPTSTQPALDLELLQVIELSFQRGGRDGSSDILVVGRQSMKVPEAESAQLGSGSDYLLVSGHHLHFRISSEGRLECTTVARNKRAAFLNGRVLSHKDWAVLEEGSQLSLVKDSFAFGVYQGPVPVGLSYIQADVATEAAPATSSLKRKEQSPATASLSCNDDGRTEPVLVVAANDCKRARQEMPGAEAEMEKQQPQQPLLRELQQEEEEKHEAAKTLRIAAELECPICTFPLACAHVTKCGHSFCFECLHQHWTYAKSNHLCPSCSLPYRLSESTPTYVVDSMVRGSLAGPFLQEWEDRVNDGRQLQATFRNAVDLQEAKIPHSLALTELGSVRRHARVSNSSSLIVGNAPKAPDLIDLTKDSPPRVIIGKGSDNEPFEIL